VGAATQLWRTLQQRTRGALQQRTFGALQQRTRGALQQRVLWQQDCWQQLGATGAQQLGAGATGAQQLGATAGAGAQQLGATAGAGAGAQQLGAGAGAAQLGIAWQQLCWPQGPPNRLNRPASACEPPTNTMNAAAVNVNHFIIAISWEK